MDLVIYALCTITACLCAFFLLRGYLMTRMRLLLWSGLCFVLIAGSNIVSIVDRWVVPDLSLMNVRLVLSLSGVLLLIYGLVWERE